MKIKIRNFKLFDSILQTILFLVFTWCLNTASFYRETFFILLTWQVVSALIHLTFKKITKLKKERKMHLIVLGVYLLIYLSVIFMLPEHYINEQFADGVKSLPVNDLIFVSIGMCICFWYCVISFREIKRIVEKNFHN